MDSDLTSRSDFCEAAVAAIKAAYKFRYPSPGYRQELVWPNQDVWDLRDTGIPMVLEIIPANEEALYDPEDEEPDYPKFDLGSLVQIRISVKFPAKFILLWKPPVDQMMLMSPSAFLKDGLIGSGTTIFPAAMMTPRADGKPGARSLRTGPVGWHTLIAVAVECEAPIELPAPGADGKARVFEGQEYTLLFEQLRRLRASEVQLSAGITHFRVVE